MGVWQIGVDELISSHFALSPLAETFAALAVLERRAPIGLDGQWYRRHAPGWARRLDADAAARLLVRVLLRRRWTTDFTSPPPHPDDRTFDDELNRVRQTPSEVAVADLTTGLDAPIDLPPALLTADIPNLAADLIAWVWTTAVHADWPRRRHILEADIISRTQELSHGGWSAALQGLRPGMRWLGDGQLLIDAHDTPHRSLAGRRLSFVPVTTGSGWTAWHEPDSYVLVYPARGVHAGASSAISDQAPSGPVAASLSRLLGAGRATILTSLQQPHSTTQLAASTGYSIGAVGGHLAVLRSAGLIDRRRTGRSVLYYLTPLGAATLRANGPQRSQ